jgi:hypothetical protein
LDAAVVEGGAVGLLVVSGVVALAKQDGDELGSGVEVGAGFADGFHPAVEFDAFRRGRRLDRREPDRVRKGDSASCSATPI